MGGSFKREGIYVYLWLIRSDRKQQNSIKQLSFNKKQVKKSKYDSQIQLILLHLDVVIKFQIISKFQLSTTEFITKPLSCCQYDPCGRTD